MRSFYTVRFQFTLEGRNGMAWIRVCRRRLAGQVFPPGWSHVLCGPLAVGLFIARLHEAEGLGLLADVTDSETFPCRQAGAFSTN